MKIHLSNNLERYIQAKVQSGRFAFADEAIAAAVRLLRQREEAEDAHVLDGIRHSLEHMEAGRGRLADEVFATIRRECNFREVGSVTP